MSVVNVALWPGCLQVESTPAAGADALPQAQARCLGHWEGPSGASRSAQALSLGAAGCAGENVGIAESQREVALGSAVKRRIAQ